MNPIWENFRDEKRYIKYLIVFQYHAAVMNQAIMMCNWFWSCTLINSLEGIKGHKVENGPQGYFY